MESRTKFLGHPLHPMLIVFPVGLFVTAVILDIVWLSAGNPRFADASFIMISAGIIGAVAAAIAGYLDWRWIPANTRARVVGLYHGVGNVFVLAFFAISWYLRSGLPAAPPTSALVWSFIGIATACVTAWLGGELVDRLGVGVDDGAHLNSSNSLSGEPAFQEERPGPGIGGTGPTGTSRKVGNY